MLNTYKQFKFTTSIYEFVLLFWPISEFDILLRQIVSHYIHKQNALWPIKPARNICFCCTQMHDLQRVQQFRYCWRIYSLFISTKVKKRLYVRYLIITYTSCPKILREASLCASADIMLKYIKKYSISTGWREADWHNSSIDKSYMGAKEKSKSI